MREAGVIWFGRASLGGLLRLTPVMGLTSTIELQVMWAPHQLGLVPTCIARQHDAVVVQRLPNGRHGSHIDVGMAPAPSLIINLKQPPWHQVVLHDELRQGLKGSSASCGCLDGGKRLCPPEVGLWGCLISCVKGPLEAAELACHSVKTVAA